MCRVLSYLGRPIVMSELLYLPDNSFIKQSYRPKYMSHLLNLAGFGMMAWENDSYNAALPFVYKTPQLPFYDENIHNLTSKITPHCFLAHLRGVSYSEAQVVSMQNVHPFMSTTSNIVLAHNGILFAFEKMKFDLLKYIHPSLQKSIRGTTDTEWIYLIFLSQLPHLSEELNVSEIICAVNDTLNIIKKVRIKHHININSPVNLFISDGNFIAATRFVYDFGWPSEEEHMLTHAAYHSLWYTYGESYGFYGNQYKMKGSNKKTSIIIASEPLTEDTTTWIEVPEYTLIFARKLKNEIQIISQDIQL